VEAAITRRRATTLLALLEPVHHHHSRGATVAMRCHTVLPGCGVK
jgi:hypothetical protein